MNEGEYRLDGIVAGVLAGERPGPSELSEAEGVAVCGQVAPLECEIQA